MPSRTSGRSQMDTSPSCRTSFWSSSVPLRTYSLVLASRRRSQSKPAAVSPVRRSSRSMIMPHTARIVPDAIGSRIRILPFHSGASSSSQSCGACEDASASRA